MNEIEKIIRSARHPVALTGAGISAPSGIPTFQSMWKGKPVRDYLSREFFNSNPEEFFELFISMCGWCDKDPNEAHRALAAMKIPVITQNVDGLHEKAGSKDVYPLHGTLKTVHCSRCGKKRSSKEFADALRPHYEANDMDAVRRNLLCPECGGQMDVDVVLYGNAIHNWYEALNLATEADVMLVIGTSLITYPAARLPEMARARGARVIVINDDCISALKGIVHPEEEL